MRHTDTERESAKWGETIISQVCVFINEGGIYKWRKYNTENNFKIHQ